MNALRLKTHHFHTKLPYQKPMLRQIKWWLQNGPITKNGVFSVTSLFFWKLCFSLKTSCKELIRCTNNPNAYICTFYKHWSFIWRCFFPVSILKLTIFFRPKFPKKRITIRKWKNCTYACVHGRYLLYQTFPHGGRETQRYFNVSSPFSRRDNNTFWCGIISKKK